MQTKPRCGPGTRGLFSEERGPRNRNKLSILQRPLAGIKGANSDAVSCWFFCPRGPGLTLGEPHYQRRLASVGHFKGFLEKRREGQESWAAFRSRFAFFLLPACKVMMIFFQVA